MISKDLRDYVKVYKNIFDKEFCDQTVESLKAAEWHLHSFYEPQTGDLVSYDKELSVSWDMIMEKPVIHQRLWGVIEQYILKDHSHFKEWFSGWTGYTVPRFNKYDVNTQMKLHCDHIHSMFDGNVKGIPILSIVGSLNNDYEGGEFIMWDDEKIELEAGDVMIFPSNFMYPHRVEKVTTGTRYSFVSWTH